MSQAPNPNAAKRKPMMTALAAAFLLAGACYALYYTLVLSQREETDNAYVGGNLVALTSQVNGTVVDIRADETRFVKAGENVVMLDPADAEVALRQAGAQLGETVRQLRQQYAGAGQYDKLVAQRASDLARAEADYQRRQPLVADQVVSAEDADHARRAMEAARAALEAARRQAEAAHALVDGVELQKHPTVLKARANFVQAWLAARRNALVAPVSGYVAKRSAQVGTRVSPGTTVLSIVPLDQLWVDANFKESELANIRIGQKAKVTTDMYGGKVVYEGKVVGLGAGTGSAFSLLPAQNATGNWIKVVQRVPVRISLDPKALMEHPLRIGLSTTVEVETRDRSGPVLAATPANQSLYQTRALAQPLPEADALADKIIAGNAGH
ncbi:HlyD family secretion protein [Paludibacterium paludis]|uniref:Multidrug resistance protein A n=1 Tax=Paludibacterium paludis TaxID=1225769 RepID=A0A918P0E6_9NEIS|nr:HlyD family efflux transporter periplasmic adaptor subunit [Paludibacterium paludis]GGY11201.1 multidrug resistance protein A [Paludibacterium paludis]